MDREDSGTDRDRSLDLDRADSTAQRAKGGPALARLPGAQASGRRHKLTAETSAASPGRS
jgi:hypothetical protein